MHHMRGQICKHEGTCVCVYHTKLFAPVPSLFQCNWFCDQNTFFNPIVKEERRTCQTGGNNHRPATEPPPPYKIKIF